MFGKRIGVDLGTANVLVYVKGRGIVINEPSVVAVAQRDNSIAAIGARIPVNIPQGHMIVDIGGGRTEAAIISMYGIVVTESVRVAGDRLDDAIANHVKRRHNIIIGDRTAEELKIAIGSALPLEEELTYQVRGRDQISGLPRTITVTSSDITQGISDSIQSIVGAIRSVLERTPPELASDVVDRGIVL